MKTSPWELCQTAQRIATRQNRRRSSRHRLALEVLEQRLVLTAPAVAGVYPVEMTHTAPVTTDVSIHFDQAIDPSTVSTASIAVHGMQTGQLLDPPNRVWLNDGAGSFRDGGQAVGASWSQAVALGDLDDDGDLTSG